MKGNRHSKSCSNNFQSPCGQWKVKKYSQSGFFPESLKEGLIACGEWSVGQQPSLEKLYCTVL